LAVFILWKAEIKIKYFSLSITYIDPTSAPESFTRLTTSALYFWLICFGSFGEDLPNKECFHFLPSAMNLFGFGLVPFVNPTVRDERPNSQPSKRMPKIFMLLFAFLQKFVLSVLGVGRFSTAIPYRFPARNRVTVECRKVPDGP
jgi:hypothetical protein